jgi:hypothetical protein
VQLQASPPGGNLGGAVAGALIGGPIGLLVGLGSAAASIFGAAQYQSKLENLLKSGCSAVGPAAAYRGWYQDTHAFTFLNRDYADAFRRENAGTFAS